MGDDKGNLPENYRITNYNYNGVEGLLLVAEQYQPVLVPCVYDLMSKLVGSASHLYRYRI